MEHIDALRSEFNTLRRLLGHPTIWSVVTVMRGPDSNRQGTAKWIFVGRFRSLVLGSPGGFVGVRRPSPYVHSVALRELSREPYNVHFAEHVLEALDALYEVGLLERSEYDFLRNLMWSWNRGAVENFGEEFPELYEKFVVEQKGGFFS